MLPTAAAQQGPLQARTTNRHKYTPIVRVAVLMLTASVQPSTGHQCQLNPKSVRSTRVAHKSHRIGDSRR